MSVLAQARKFVGTVPKVTSSQSWVMIPGRGPSFLRKRHTMGFRVWGLGCRVWGFGLRFRGLELRYESLSGIITKDDHTGRTPWLRLVVPSNIQAGMLRFFSAEMQKLGHPNVSKHGLFVST